VELIREILASHESGISRDGLLAWARLRGSPQMTDDELDAVLAAMGDEVVDVQGFLYLRRFAPGSPPTAVPPPPPPPAWGPAAAGAGDEVPAWSPPAGAGWSPPEGVAWPPPDQPTWTPPDSPSGGRRTRLIAAAAVGVFVAVSLVVSIMLRDEESSDVTVVPTPTAGTVVSAESLAVGNCIVLPSEDEFDDVRTLACTEPHDGEVFFVGDHPDGAFPSDEAFEAFVDEQCLPAFAAFTGSDYYEQEVLEVGWFTPTEGAWGRGDREVVCHLTPADGSQTDRSWRGGNP
jgi:hypothetical protein